MADNGADLGEGGERDDLCDPGSGSDAQCVRVEKPARYLAGRRELSGPEVRTPSWGDAQSRPHSVAFVVHVAEVDDAEDVQALEGDPVRHFRDGHRLDARSLRPALDQSVDPGGATIRTDE